MKSIDDCRQLQKIVDMFSNWCKDNCMSISVGKCAVISFSRSKNPLMWPYSIEGGAIERVSSFKDLGVILDTQLTFREHYSFVIAKANKNLGFIFRISKEFTDPHCLRSLYCSLVRSILETAVVVWSPYHDVWIKRIESVQSKFIRYALRFLPWNNPYELPPYENRCRLLELDTLEKRRKVAMAVFAGKILTGSIDAPYILSKFNLNVIPRPLRTRTFLRLDFQLCANKSQLDEYICAVFNCVFDLFDFNVNIDVFHNRLSSSL